MIDLLQRHIAVTRGDIYCDILFDYIHYPACLHISVDEGKISAKNAQQKKTTTQSSRKSATTHTMSRSPAGADRSKVKVTSFVAVSSCSVSGMIVRDDSKALQCDHCQKVRWKCADCLSTKMYEELLAEQCCLRWFCEDCDMLVINTGRNHAGYHSGSGADRIDKLVVAVEKLVEQFTNVNARMDEKCDRAIVNHLEGRVCKLEEQLIKGYNDLECRLAEVDKLLTESGKRYSSVKHRYTSIDQQLLKCTEVKEDELKVHNCKEGAVKSQLEDDKQEEQEIEKRKTSVIINGIAKSAV